MQKSYCYTPGVPSASVSTCKMLGQMLKSWNFSLSVFFLHFSYFYHTNKAPYNKSSRQARIRWLWHLWFDFSSETAEWNSTKLDRNQDLNVLYRVCVFQAKLKNKMAALASDWLRHFWLLLWKGSTEFNETWQEARSQRPLPSLCFSVGSEKQDGRPGLWLADWQISVKGDTMT